MNAEIARETWSYDTDTGELRWKVARGQRTKVGDLAGSVYRPKRNVTKYRQVKFDGRVYSMHRIIWLIVHGDWPQLQIDHIDGNGMNNRLENLRDVPNSENCKNTRLSNRNVSGRCGVGWSKRHSKWRASIRNEGKLIHLGYFDEFDDASAARSEAEVKYGFHHNHGQRRDSQCQS